MNNLLKFFDYKLSFRDALDIAVNPNRYIRLSDWTPGLYLEVKYNTTDGCYMCRLVNLDDKGNVLMKQAWNTSINIDYVIKDEWDVYQAFE